MALSVTLTPGKTWQNASDPLTPAKLNATGNPAVAISGTASTSQIADDAVTAAKAAFGAWFLVTDSGTANAHVLAASGHTISAYANGLRVRYEVNAGPNTGTVTANLAGLGAKTIVKRNGRTLEAGDLQDGMLVELILLQVGATQYWWLTSNLSWEDVIRGESAGGTDAYAFSAGSGSGAWTFTQASLQGRLICFKADVANTGACTLNVNALGAIAIKKNHDEDTATGDIEAGQWVCVIYDGTYYQMVSPPIPSSARATVPVRQTVLGGPVDSNGHAAVLSYSGQAVTLEASSDDPFVAAFAAGFDASGAVDYIHRLTADAASAWTIPTTNATYYLFVDRDASTGAITYGYTTTAPSYADDDAASISSGAHTFLKNRMKMYLGDGAAAAEKQRVFIGTALVSASAISAVTSYMFRGQFQSSADQTFTLANSSKSETHKLGLTPRVHRWVLVNQSTEHGYAVGDEVDVRSIVRSADSIGLPPNTRANATTLEIRYKWGTEAPYLLDSAGPSVQQALTAANWKLRAYAERGW